MASESIETPAKLEGIILEVISLLAKTLKWIG